MAEYLTLPIENLLVVLDNISLTIEKLRCEFGDIRSFERLARLVGAVEHGILEQVAQLALVKRHALARFDEIALDHHEWIAFDLYLQSLAKVAGVVDGHGRYSLLC